MKEIKFRAWIKPTAHMIQVDLLKFNKDGIIVEQHKENETPPFDLLTRWSITDNLDADGEHDCHLMQFTGLHDKKGKDIYEGDIVHDETIGRANKSFLIEDLQRVFHLYGEHVFQPDQVEVIGNIYENPELLKG
jgi:uncharacterized phage protein (TIGR01671 family)